MSDLIDFKFVNRTCVTIERGMRRLVRDLADGGALAEIERAVIEWTRSTFRQHQAYCLPQSLILLPVEGCFDQIAAELRSRERLVEAGDYYRTLIAELLDEFVGNRIFTSQMYLKPGGLWHGGVSRPDWVERLHQTIKEIRNDHRLTSDHAKSLHSIATPLNPTTIAGHLVGMIAKIIAVPTGPNSAFMGNVLPNPWDENYWLDGVDSRYKTSEWVPEGIDWHKIGYLVSQLRGEEPVRTDYIFRGWRNVTMSVW